MFVHTKPAFVIPCAGQERPLARIGIRGWDDRHVGDFQIELLAGAHADKIGAYRNVAVTTPRNSDNANREYGDAGCDIRALARPLN